MGDHFSNRSYRLGGIAAKGVCADDFPELIVKEKRRAAHNNLGITARTIELFPELFDKKRRSEHECTDATNAANAAANDSTGWSAGW